MGRRRPHRRRGCRPCRGSTCPRCWPTRRHRCGTHVLFAQDSAQTTELNKVRYALRGFYDGRTKYARYYGVGGGKPSTGLWGKSPGTKLFDVDCAFDDNDHEWYDHDADPDELVNLANDRSRRAELRDTYERMRAYERESFVSFA